jgi:lysylphosphatidylglycerol synthetase-like protein (DUF2156 family)
VSDAGLKRSEQAMSQDPSEKNSPTGSISQEHESSRAVASPVLNALLLDDAEYKRDRINSNDVSTIRSRQKSGLTISMLLLLTAVAAVIFAIAVPGAQGFLKSELRYGIRLGIFLASIIGAELVGVAYGLYSQRKVAGMLYGIAVGLPSGILLALFHFIPDDQIEQTIVSFISALLLLIVMAFVWRVRTL